MTDRVRTYPALDLSWRPSDPDGLTVPERLAIAFDGLEVLAIHEVDTGWRVSFASAEARDRAAHVLEDQVGPAGLRVSPLEITDDDWARRSQAGLRSVRVGDIVVAPPWDEAPGAPAGARLLIRILPSMGFGTGHHATTRLCLRLLQGIDLAGRSFLDIGTGSGVLAIAAYLLGAAPVTAIDTDRDAVEAARENLGLNGVSQRVHLITGDFRHTVGVRARTVAANLTGAMLVQGRRELLALVEPGGILIASGFERHEAAVVLSALTEIGVLVDEGEEEGWCAVTVGRRPRL